METQGIETRTEGVLGEEAEEFSAGATGLDFQMGLHRQEWKD